MKEAKRYIDNAKELLSKSAIEDGMYADKKYVKSACGVAYLGILEAVNNTLLRKGLSNKDLPKKIEEYEKAIRKHLSANNGKLLREFTNLYEELHIAGYYRGLLHRVDTVKAVIKGAREFISKLK